MARKADMTAPLDMALVATTEEVLAGHPGVLDSAAVAASRADPGDSTIDVVVVLSVMSCVLEVREDLRAALCAAGYDVEPAVLAVAQMPDKPLDSVAELASAQGISRYEPPASELEEDLAGRLAAILGLARVGVLDDFVDLGGDSLTAVAFLNTVQEAHHVPLSLVELFAAGTVRSIAQLLAERVVTSAGPG